MNFKQRLLYPFARRFFAGETLDDALSRARLVNSAGMGATLDFLGENVSGRSEAEAALTEYMRVVDAIAEGNLDASLAVKLTHIGLGVDKKMAEEHALELAGHAARRGVFVWLDMEGSAHTDNTIWAYRRLHETYGNVGLALQACLKRTWRDLKELVPDDAVVRLVKGAYREPPEAALQDMTRIRAQFEGMMEYLFSECPRFAVGTHDRSLIKKAATLSKGYRGEFEFQMLMGMRDDLKRALLAENFRVIEYIPYGADWYGYGIRRLLERRRNLLDFAQGLVGK